MWETLSRRQLPHVRFQTAWLPICPLGMQPVAMGAIVERTTTAEVVAATMVVEEAEMAATMAEMVAPVVHKRDCRSLSFVDQ